MTGFSDLAKGADLDARLKRAFVKRVLFPMAWNVHHVRTLDDKLTAAKDAYRFSLEMTGEAALNFAAAKSDQLTMRQNDSWRSEGIGDFLQGKYRPGLAGHKSADK